MFYLYTKSLKSSKKSYNWSHFRRVSSNALSFTYFWPFTTLLACALWFYCLELIQVALFLQLEYVNKVSFPCSFLEVVTFFHCKAKTFCFFLVEHDRLWWVHHGCFPLGWSGKVDVETLLFRSLSILVFRECDGEECRMRRNKGEESSSVGETGKQ